MGMADHAGRAGGRFPVAAHREKCLKGWEISCRRTLGEIEEELGQNDETWKKIAPCALCRRGVHMSIKQMSGQLLSVDIADQGALYDLQRMRRPADLDECKHSKLHADAVAGQRLIKNERELMDIAQANTQPAARLFRHVDDVPAHSPAGPRRPELLSGSQACIGIMAYLDRVDDPSSGTSI